MTDAAKQGITGSRRSAAWPWLRARRSGWVNALDMPGPPPNRGAVVLDQVGVVTVGVVGLGVMLRCLACAGRWVRDRGRLAACAVGRCDPQWTRCFWSRG